MNKLGLKRSTTSLSLIPLESYKWEGRKPWKTSKNAILSKNSENSKRKRKEKMPLSWGWDRIRSASSSKEDRRRRGEGGRKKTSQIRSVVTPYLFRKVRAYDQWSQYQHHQPLIHYLRNGSKACTDQNPHLQRTKQFLIERFNNV